MKSHVGFAKCPAHALVVGSPERAEWISQTFLKNSRTLAKNREYHSYVGNTAAGTEVLVLSHGVGASGATIAFREIMNAGAKKIIRVGTAGGLFQGAKIGDIVVAQAAVRGEGTSAAMIPLEFPATADPEMTLSLFKSLQDKTKQAFLGTVVTQDIFYPGLLDNKLELYAKAHCLAVEMEISALYVAASLEDIKATSCVVLDGNPLEWDKGNYDPSPERLQSSMTLAIESALKTLS